MQTMTKWQMRWSLAFLLAMAVAMAFGVVRDARAAAGPADESLNVPQGQVVNVSSICLSHLEIDVKSKTVVVGYEGCDTTTAPPTYNGNIYTATVTASGFTLNEPFGVVVVGTSVTWTQAVTDMGSIRGLVKTFIQRFGPLQGS